MLVFHVIKTLGSVTTYLHEGDSEVSSVFPEAVLLVIEDCIDRLPNCFVNLAHFLLGELPAVIEALDSIEFLLVVHQ